MKEKITANRPDYSGSEKPLEQLDKLVELSLLYDFYGALLSEHKQQIFEDYVLNDLSLTIPLIVSNEVILKPDTNETRLMKNMIAEFAIHANTIFAKELDINNLFIRKLELNKDNNYTFSVFYNNGNLLTTIPYLSNDGFTYSTVFFYLIDNSNLLLFKSGFKTNFSIFIILKSEYLHLKYKIILQDVKLRSNLKLLCHQHHILLIYY